MPRYASVLEMKKVFTGFESMVGGNEMFPRIHQPGHCEKNRSRELQVVAPATQGPGQPPIPTYTPEMIGASTPTN